MVFSQYLTNVKGKGATPEEAMEQNDVQQSKRDGHVFLGMDVARQSALTDEEVAAKHKNPSDPTVASPSSNTKMQITKAIWDAGIRYSIRSDNDFTFPLAPK